MERKLSVIETLRTVTEGKIFVEVERARVTRILTHIKRDQGDISAAKDILCELQVETFGSMTRREKTEFILEQVALCIEDGDWTQAGILGRKISTRYFARRTKKTKEELEKRKQELEEKARKQAGTEVGDTADLDKQDVEDDVTDLKLRYYEQQITLAKHDDKYLEACKHYRQVLDTEAVEENPDLLKPTLQRVVYFALLAPYDNEQSDLLHRIAQDQRISAHSPTSSRRKPTRKNPSATSAGSTCASASSSTTSASSPSTTRASPSRYISDLVTSKTIYARIDRPAGVVSFEKKRDADEVLNEWSGSMKSLLGLLRSRRRRLSRRRLGLIRALGLGVQLSDSRSREGSADVVVPWYPHERERKIPPGFTPHLLCSLSFLYLMSPKRETEEGKRDTKIQDIGNGERRGKGKKKTLGLLHQRGREVGGGWEGRRGHLVALLAPLVVLLVQRLCKEI
ncbi:hypothetical protein KC348_g48 [Hortaea werneckii]|nr:hypothetical protein KC348_g48 [Hortaea werneckii]